MPKKARARRPKAQDEGPKSTRAPAFNPLPEGSRDLLPDAFRLRRAITAGLLDCFERWGYEPVATPNVEYFEVMKLGLGEQERERSVRFIEAGSGQLVTLRSDITPQVARMVAQRMGGTLGPEDTVRVCYAADVVRVPDRRHQRAELHQAGVELVGDGDPFADAELIALCHEALKGVGLGRMGIDLAHTDLVRHAFAGLRIEGRQAQRLRAYLGRKDAGGLEAELSRIGVKGKARAAVLSLCELHGPPEVLATARKQLAGLDVGDAIDRLDQVIAALGANDPAALARVTLDLGEVRGFDYYTGFRMRVWAPGVSEPIARGGRYNDLLARYGVDRPATGFAIDLDALERALVHAEVEVAGASRPAGRLVAVHPDCDDSETRAAAIAEARSARSRGLRSWVEVGLDLEQAQLAADRGGAERLTFFRRRNARSKSGTREAWRRNQKGWRTDATKRKRSK